MALDIFPTLPGLSVLKQRNSNWRSQVEEAVGGQMNGYSYWTYPRRSYVLSFNFLRSAVAYQEWQNLVAFFDKQKGRTAVWQFDDPRDNAVTGQAFGTGDGATKTFQLVRALGGNTAPVFALNGAPVVKVAGTVTAVTVGTLGTVTFAAAPANGAALTWTGAYYWICRFDDDVLETEEFSGGLHAVKELKFSTEKF